MNKDRVIQIARNCGATPYTNRHYPDRPTHTFNVDQLNDFAKAIRNEALEEAAKKCEYVGPQGNPMALINVAFAQEIRNLKEQP